MDGREIWQRIQRVHSGIGFEYARRLINDSLMEIARYKPSRKSAKIDVVNGQRYYDLGDKGSNLKVDKVYSVSYMDEDGLYVKIPRLLDWQNLREQDIT